MNIDPAQKAYNIGIVLEELKQLPQTYDSILKYKKKERTLQVIITRKLNTLCYDGMINKTIIPQTRFGKVMFYVPDKDYNIVFISNRPNVETYCFKEYKKIDKMTIKVDKHFILIGDTWEERGEIILNLDKVLKWV